MNDATTKCLDILTSALEMETRGREYYEAAMKTVQNPLGKEIFAMLRDYEIQHEVKIKEIYASLQAGQAWSPQLAECPISSDLGGVFRKLAHEQAAHVGAGASDIEALNVGITFESASVKFYEDHAKAASDPFEKKFAQRMMQEERGHLNFLTDIRHYFTDPETWFQEKERSHWDGA